jgi:outer membrane protein assembly factor BamB
LYALDAETGDVRWWKEVSSEGASVYPESAVVTDDTIVVAASASDESHIIVYDAATGDIKWSKEIATAYNFVGAGNRLYHMQESETDDVEQLVRRDLAPGDVLSERDLDFESLTDEAAFLTKLVVTDQTVYVRTYFGQGPTTDIVALQSAQQQDGGNDGDSDDGSDGDDGDESDTGNSDDGSDGSSDDGSEDDGSDDSSGDESGGSDDDEC